MDVDRMVGRLVGALKDTGALSSTFVAFRRCGVPRLVEVDDRRKSAMHPTEIGSYRIVCFLGQVIVVCRVHRTILVSIPTEVHCGCQTSRAVVSS